MLTPKIVPEDLTKSSTLSNEEIEEWFKNLPPMSEERMKEIDGIVNQAFERAFGRPLQRPDKP